MKTFSVGIFLLVAAAGAHARGFAAHGGGGHGHSAPHHQVYYHHSGHSGHSGSRVFIGGFFGAPFYSPFYYPYYAPYYAPYPYPYPYTYPYPVYGYPPPPPAAQSGPGAAPEQEDSAPPQEESAPDEGLRATYGLVQLRGVPDGAAIDLDGRFWLTAKQLDQRWLALPHGEHTLSVRVRGAEPVERHLSVAAGQTQVVRLGPFRQRPS